MLGWNSAARSWLDTKSDLTLRMLNCFQVDEGFGMLSMPKCGRWVLRGSKEGRSTLVWGSWGPRCRENPAGQCHIPSATVSLASLGQQADMRYSFDWHLYSPPSWSHVWSVPELFMLNLLMHLMSTFIQNPTLIKFYQMYVTQKPLVPLALHLAESGLWSVLVFQALLQRNCIFPKGPLKFRWFSGLTAAPAHQKPLVPGATLVHSVAPMDHQLRKLFSLLKEKSRRGLNRPEQSTDTAASWTRIYWGEKPAEHIASGKAEWGWLMYQLPTDSPSL